MVNNQREAIQLQIANAQVIVELLSRLADDDHAAHALHMVARYLETAQELLEVSK